MLPSGVGAAQGSRNSWREILCSRAISAKESPLILSWYLIHSRFLSRSRGTSEQLLLLAFDLSICAPNSAYGIFL